MKLIDHGRVVRPASLELRCDPLQIWLSKTVELRISRGDRLDAVAAIVASSWPLSTAEVRRLVALWFALGERRAAGDPASAWTARELRAGPTRRYLTR